MSEKEITNNTEAPQQSKVGDKYIWGIFITIYLISIIEAYSASSREIATSGLYTPLIKHTSQLLTGGLIVYFMQRVPYYKYIKFIPFFGVLTIGLLAYAQFAGKAMNNAQRAIYLPGFTIQPAEMAKLGIVLLIAWFTAKNQKIEGINDKGIVICVVLISIFGGLLVLQGLTNTILLMCISLSLLLIGGIEWKKFGIIIGVYIVMAGIFFGISSIFKDSQPDNMANKATVVELTVNNNTAKKESSRFETWVNRIKRFSDSDSLLHRNFGGKDDQELYARMAQANGGLIGVGPGNSRECSRLPLAFSDYIYSIIVEELGYIGGIAVLILYLWLFARAGSIASRCNRAFPALLVMGAAVMVVFQALFHICINVGVMPVSGQPLPLISKGGTSILMTCIAFGLMLSVSRTAVQNNKSKKEVTNEISELPEDMQGSNQSQIK